MDASKVKTHRRNLLLGGLALLAFASPAGAQVNPRPRRRRRVRRAVLAGWRNNILERRRLNPDRFERSRRGENVVRARVIAIDPSDAGIAAMRRLGFRRISDRMVGDLGVRVIVLRPPPGMSAQDAVDALQAADPQGAYELNHVFDPSQGVSGASAPAAPRSSNGAGLKLGMIDGGIATGHPSLSGARIQARNFTGEGAPVASPHGTAVASLLIGADDDFRGAAPGAELYAADVFGDAPEGGSAEAIADALGWLSQQGVSVVNISLEGPANRLVEAVCRAAIARGMILVAAVGNGGPTTPVAYPAAYAGVIAVTAVDSQNRVYLSANRGPQVAFAAVGVSIEAAAEGDEYEVVSGTSFASPIVAAELALARRSAASASTAINALAAGAVDLGAPGRDAVYGFGRVM